MLKTLFLIVTLTAGAAVASAQVLPGVGDTLGHTVPDTLGSARDTARDTLNATADTLRNAHATAAAALLRSHRSLIDTDNQGFPAVRFEVVAIAPSEAAIATARARGFSVSQTTESRELGLTVIVLRAPPGMSTRRALTLLRQLDAEGVYDYNHIYFGAGPAQVSAQPTVQTRRGRANGPRIGLIDSGIDAEHPAFANISVNQRGFAGAHALADAHGTAVASLIAHACPGAALFVADIYGGQPNGGSAAALVAAMAWLAQSRVSVINVSLVGPPNRTLEAVIRAAIAHGIVLVAAVGNDGPSAPPLYPASYPGVIGVTGVDAREHVLPEAGRGAQVDFAAPGSEMAAAALGGRYVTVRGTSFASPIVAGLIAGNLGDSDAAGAEATLARSAIDLGAHGVDPVYGAGFVGAEQRAAMVARR